MGNEAQRLLAALTARLLTVTLILAFLDYASAENRVPPGNRTQGQALEGWLTSATGPAFATHARSLERTGSSTGSGFVVGSQGWVLTNRHVVDGCRSVTLRHGTATTRVHRAVKDQRYDLALLQPKTAFQATPAPFRVEQPPALGERIYVAGYPREVAGSGLLKVMSGTVALLHEQARQTTTMYLSIPVDAGGSGGPVLDSAGQVIGIATGILRIKTTGLPAQNPGVALTGDVIRAFLRRHGISYETGTAKTLGIRTVAEQARRFVVMTECQR